MNTALYEYLSRLNITQFKCFYSAFVHYWIEHKFFISKQNFLNLWCELNLCCHELDESFPDQYEDHKAVKDFCHAHPYYFIDILPLDLVAKLFAEYVDERIDVLINVAKLLHEADLQAAYTYANDALGLEEDIDTLTSEAQEHLKMFSY
jgi:hypothetical protein